MKEVARCGIYESRPDVCRKYPTAEHYVPPECTYTFPSSDVRQGECDCGKGACCSIPREKGEPGGTPMPEISGGEPCKHLVWTEVEEPLEKEAAEEGQLANDTEMGVSQLLPVLGQDAF